MVKRAIFYDDCRDASRLAAEWAQTTPARWTSEYSAPNFYYRTTMPAGIEICTLMSFIVVKDFEILLKVRSSILGGDIGVLIRKGRNISDAETGSILVHMSNIPDIAIYVYDGAYQVLGSAAHTMLANQWYWLRCRVIGNSFKAKSWLVGVAEPDWMLSVYMTRITLGGKMPSPLTIAFRSYSTVAATKDYSDIRITPIPRTGFP